MAETREVNNQNEKKQFSISIEKKPASEKRRVVALSVKDIDGITVNKVCVGIFPNF